MKAHGLRGEVVIRSLSDAESRWKVGAVFHLDFDNKQIKLVSEKLTIVEATVDGEFIRTKFAEVDGRDNAEKLVGGYLEVEERIQSKNKWFFYIDDLLGMTVHDETGAVAGEVVDVQELPASHVIEVRGSTGETAMVPFMKRFIKSVDTPSRIIVVKLIPGLLPWMDKDGQ